MTHPYPPRSKQSCGNCYYCPDHTRECRRYAPRPALGAQAGYESYWPDISGDMWCGEWAPQEVSE